MYRSACGCPVMGVSLTIVLAAIWFHSEITLASPSGGFAAAVPLVAGSRASITSNATATGQMRRLRVRIAVPFWQATALVGEEELSRRARWVRGREVAMIAATGRSS